MPSSSGKGCKEEYPMSFSGDVSISGGSAAGIVPDWEGIVA